MKQSRRAFSNELQEKGRKVDGEDQDDNNAKRQGQGGIGIYYGNVKKACPALEVPRYLADLGQLSGICERGKRHRRQERRRGPMGQPHNLADATTSSKPRPISGGWKHGQGHGHIDPHSIAGLSSGQ